MSEKGIPCVCVQSRVDVGVLYRDTGVVRSRVMDEGRGYEGQCPSVIVPGDVVMFVSE